VHIQLTVGEDTLLADEATRRGCSKSDVIRSRIAALEKEKPRGR
jgi:hypothetical protein